MTIYLNIQDLYVVINVTLTWFREIKIYVLSYWNYIDFLIVKFRKKISKLINGIVLFL